MENGAYIEFLESKLQLSRSCGFEIDLAEINPILKPHQRDIVRWAVRKGRAAIFAAFGLGKTFMQLEIARLIAKNTGGRFLIVAPLGVRQEFKRDAAKLGLDIQFIRRIEECEQIGLDGRMASLFITNYETIREGKLDPRLFAGVSLDEAAILRGFGGTKTFREFMGLFEGTDTYRFVATATPSPNEFIELLAYAAFLDVMDVGQAKTRFFQRNSEKADHLTLLPHKEREFWLWVSTWAIFLQRPSDLGYSDEGYELPEMEVCWHELPSDHSDAGEERSGQARLLRDAAINVQNAAREKRDSLEARIEKLLALRREAVEAKVAEVLPANETRNGLIAELRFEQPHFIVWHDLEAERTAIEKALPEAVSVYGSQDMEER